MQNATDGISTLQIADGGLGNISQIPGRLQQTSMAALSQANSAPQAVLSLLKNLS